MLSILMVMGITAIVAAVLIGVFVAWAVEILAKED